MSNIFIIDEWLWSDLNGDNGKEKQKEAFQFLCALFHKCDRITVAVHSKFRRKEHCFSKNAHKEILTRKIARFYFNVIKVNQNKYIEVNIEDNKECSLNGINIDDEYLIKTYYRINAQIVTTDTKLKTVLDSQKIPCVLRDEFLKYYID